ncbi:glycerol dehydrogenase [Suicoccus acidiformans]|uniref:Glycerol dehydrogenase n=1 Tax=Suicoccus acidiformans TaxID=2036206 RepID=A0A347WML9_9LACT|nr:iron-containing alcohol dehydrogenase family protein [Suicoccus acidiformans]AXY26326.1 glycerol dehydrogenase [Suicoccus acidiformans]
MSLSINLPNITVGVDAYEAIERYARPYGSKAVLIGGKKALAAAEARIQAALSDSSITIIDTLWYGGIASLSNISQLMDQPSVQAADMLFAVGGGNACDTVKTLGKRLGNKPVFTFPTIASNCAPTTKVSVLYEDDGEMHGLDFQDAPAIHCFADSQIIAEAPTQYLWAGIADALSKEIESEFSSRGRELTFQDQLGIQVVKGCNERLYQSGKAALEAAEQNQASPAIDKVLLEIIGTTALTSVLVDDDYSTNMGHAFYYGATRIPAGEKHLHGVLVAYGTLALLTMDEQFQARDRMLAFMQEISLPTTLKGLDIHTQAELEELTDKAMTMDDIRVSPYEITREKFLQAIEDLEAVTNA